MKIVMSRILIVICLILTLNACSTEKSADTSWLIGEWHLSFNPRNDSEDILIFKPESQLVIMTVSGKELNGIYQINNDQLKMMIAKGTRSIETLFRISTAKDQLIFTNGAYYTRANPVKEEINVPVIESK